MQHHLFSVDTALLTPRCVIRRFREGDGRPFYQLLDNNRDYLAEHFPHLLTETGPGSSPEEAEAFVRQRIAYWHLQLDYAFAVWDAEGDDLIGYVHLLDLDWGLPRGEMAFFIDREQARRGLMSEAVARVVRYAFRQLRLEKLIMLTLSDNYPSQRLGRKVGFTREGDLRNEFRRPGGALADLTRFGLTREQYGE